MSKYLPKKLYVELEEDFYEMLEKLDPEESKLLLEVFDSEWKEKTRPKE